MSGTSQLLMSATNLQLSVDDKLLRNGQLFVALRQKKPVEKKLKKIQKRLGQGAEVNATDPSDKNNTPLHIAVKKGELEVVKLLLDSGASLHEMNDDYETAIDIAHQLDIPSGPAIVKFFKKFVTIGEVNTYGNQKTDPTKERLCKPKPSQRENKKAMPGVHGAIYQLKLLMLFLKRGLDTHYSFRLGTEIQEAKKFDDLVFEIIKNGKKVYQLLQAKHKEDECKKIKLSELLTEADGDFSLVKYFFAFQDLKKERMFKNRIIENATICTNADLDLCDKYEYQSHIKIIQDLVEEIEEKDIILNFNYKHLTKIPKRYKFNYNIIPLLKGKLESYNSVRLSRKLVQCILKNDAIRHHQDDFEPYHVILAKEVIDVKNKKLQDNFVNGDNLSDYTKTFRKALVNELKKQSNDNLNLESLNEEICDKSNENIGLKLSSGFGKKKNLQTCTEKFEKNPSWPKSIREKDVKQFLKCFVFAVNQPNETQLGEIIANDISKEFNFIKADYIYNEIFQYMLDWLKGHGEEFISSETGRELFKNSIQKLCELELSAISLDYETYIKKFDIKFVSNYNEESNLFDYFNITNETNQILNLINKQPLLSAIRIKQVTKDMSQFRNRSLFTWLASAQRLLRILKQTLLCNKINLLVIESETSEEEETLSSFYKELLKILQFVKNKKIILITRKDYNLKNEDENTYFEKRNESIWFNDLAIESQEQVLNNGVAIFQEEQIKLVSLIIEEQLKNFIDGEILLKLIKKEEIQIGKMISHVCYRKNQYVNRKLSRLEFLNESLKENAIDFLFVYDENNAFNNIERNPHDSKDIIIISNNQNIFENLSKACKHRNVHWLKTQDNKLIWQKSNGTISKLRKFLNLQKEEYSPESFNDLKVTVGIIAAEPGMGKSTILTRLAEQTKSLDPTSYIIRLNLLDYAKQFREWQNCKILINKKEVSKFLCEVCISDRFEANDLTESLINLFPNILNTELSEDYYKMKSGQGLFLLEIAIFNFLYNRRQIIFLFDGFDEIVPYYKNEVLTMFKILKEFEFEKMWITTRDYNILNQLEDELSTFSFQLEPFCQKDQKLFFAKFWRTNLKICEFDQKRFDVFADNMLLKFSKSINNSKNDFLALPLHVNMVAKVFQETFRKFYNSGNEELFNNYEQEINELFNMANLYKKFVETKFFEIQFGENKICSHCFSFVEKIIKNKYEEFLKEHQYLALYVLLEESKLVFDTTIPKNEQKNIKNILEKIMSGKEKTGIIVNVTNGKPNFIHHTFAEYFAAKHFWTLFKSITLKKFKNTFFQNVIIKCLIEEDRIGICKFFISEAQNDIAANDTAFSDNIFKFDFLLKKLVQMLKKNARKKKNYKEPNKSTKSLWNIIETLFSSKEHKNINSKLISTIKSLKNDVKLSILKIACEIRNDNIASLLIEQLGTKFVKDYFQKSENWFRTPLWIAAANENLNILHKIFEILRYDVMTKGRNIDLLKTIVFQSDFVVLRSCLKLNMLDVNISIFSNTSALIGLIITRAPLDIVELFTTKTDINFVNESICCSNYNNILALMRFGSYNCNEVIVDFITKKGINLSLGINILFKTMIEIGELHGFKNKFLEKWHYFLQHYQNVKKLLKYGVGYNCINIDSKITTLKYFESTYYILKFYNKLFTIFQNQQNFKKFNLADIFSKHIINLFFQMNKEIVNWEFIINPGEFSVKNKNKKLIFREQYLSGLFYVCYKDGKSALESALTELYSYINNNMFEIECIESDISRYYDIPDGYKNVIKCLRQYTIFKSLSESAKILVKQAAVLCYKGSFSSFKETCIRNCNIFEEEILKSIEVFDRLKRVQRLRNCDKILYYTVEDIYFILNLKIIPIDYGLQKILTKGFKDQHIESVVNIRPYVSDIYEEAEQLKSFNYYSNYYFHSLQLFELLQQLDRSFRKLLDNIKVKNHQEIEIILGDLQREEPNFVKSILNSQDKKYGFLLHYAVYNSDIESVKILLNYEASPNSQLLEYCEYLKCSKSDFEKYYKGCMPLHLAAEIGDKDIIDFLLNKGSEIDCVDWFGRTPLYYAFKNEKLDIVEYLIKEKNAKHNITDLTAVTDLPKRSSDS